MSIVLVTCRAVIVMKVELLAWTRSRGGIWHEGEAMSKLSKSQGERDK